MDTKETFEAVCKRIGDHYSDKENYKVFKKKVKWIGTYLNCEMCFWSSHSNMANEYVCLEIVTSVYANDKTDMDKKGLLYVGIRPKSFNVCNLTDTLFSEIISFMDERTEYVKTLDTPEELKRLKEEINR